MREDYYSQLSEFAHFSGIMEIPIIHKPERIVIPKRIVPFSQRNRCNPDESFVCFYEDDKLFIDFLNHPEAYLDDLKRFLGVITPDPSLNNDMPLVVQLHNVYIARSIGAWLQREGIYVVPNVRWGDERTYTTQFLPEMVPYLGIEQNGIVAIGTFGCNQGNEEKTHLREGIRSLIRQCQPLYVLIYGARPKSVFEEFEEQTTFIDYPDWHKLCHRGNKDKRVLSALV